MPLKHYLRLSTLVGLLSVVVLESCYSPTLRQSQCGNGQIDEDEQCDDGNNNGLPGFCKEDCSSVEGSSCGNGQVEEDEQCDDGNNNGLYGFCKADCSGIGPYCGNSNIEEFEECDDGNNVDGDGCDKLCKNSCGNGILEPSSGEECDNGPNNADTSVCTYSCKINICGDSLILAGVEECDDGQNEVVSKPRKKSLSEKRWYDDAIQDEDKNLSTLFRRV